MPSKGSIPEPEPEPSHEPEANQPEEDVTSHNESETSLKEKTPSIDDIHHTLIISTSSNLDFLLRFE